jgi:molecular chaperone IbpA
MKNLEFNLNSLLNSFIGLHQLQHELVIASKNNTSSSFPPYNIEQVTDDNFLVTLALAGYEKNNIDISIKEDALIIRGKIDSDKEKNFAYKGIASRSFERKFQLGKDIEVHNAKLENGLLEISLLKIIPEKEEIIKININ